MDFFRINGEQIKVSDATFLIGVSGEKSLGLNCGGCGYVSCKDMEIAGAAAKANKTDYKGPNCVFKVTDLGIAVGSAAKKVVPLAASIGVYPRTQSGPLYPLSGSSTTAMEGSNSGSMGFQFFLSNATRRPELQLATSSMATRRASGSSEYKVSSRMPPARLHVPPVSKGPEHHSE
jgi:hypothetical protein